MNITDKVRESNRIEGILREPTAAEIEAHTQFVYLSRVTIKGLTDFVRVYQPDARLRDMPGLDVRVGHWCPPPGGPDIAQSLQTLLDEVNAFTIDAWDAHIAYESLHPFTDGNGRSGRVMWYWMEQVVWVQNRYPLVGSGNRHQLGFLHAFYYQTLAHVSK